MIRPVQLRWPADVALLLALTCVFFWKLLTHPGWMVYSPDSDAIFHYSPQEFFLAKAWREFGELPLWYPHIYAGTSLIGDMDTPIFYPPHLLFRAMPTELAFGYLFVFHVFLAGLFMYAFVKELGGDAVAGVVSAVAFMFCGPLISHVYAGHMMHAANFTWMPLTFLLLELCATRQRLVDPILLGVAMALQFLSGHAQFFFYSSFALALFCLLRMALLYQHDGVAASVRLALLFVGATVLCVLLTAVQLLPTLEYSKQLFGRSGYEFAAVYSLPFKHLITFLVPDFFGLPSNQTYIGAGKYWELCGYVGIVAPLLAVTALWLRRCTLTWFFAALAVFAVLFALGKHTPLLRVFYHLPGFGQFRVPARMLMVYVFAVSVLAGLGTAALMEVLQRSPQRLKLAAKALAVLFIVMLLGVGYALIGKGVIFVLIEKLYNAGRHTRTFAENLGFISVLYDQIARNLVVMTLAVGGVAATIVAAQRQKVSARIAGLMLAGVAVLELWCFGLPKMDVKKPDEVFASNPVIEFLTQDKSLHRVYASCGTLPQYIAVRHGIQKLNGYDSGVLRPFGELADKAKWPFHDFEFVKEIQVNDLTADLLSMFNAKYLVTTRPVDHPEFKLRLTAGPYSVYHMGRGIVTVERAFVYENAAVMPRAYLVSGEGDPPVRPTSFEPADVLLLTPNRVDVQVEAQSPSVLVLADTWYPGWVVVGNGGARDRLPLIKVNGALRGVKLDAGRHTVSFMYQPKSYAKGMVLSLMAICLTALSLAGLGVMSILESRHRKGAVDAKSEELSAHVPGSVHAEALLNCARK